jgi:hypothetical protein
MHVRKSLTVHTLPEFLTTGWPLPATFLQATTTIFSQSATHSKLQQLLIAHQYAARID